VKDSSFGNVFDLSELHDSGVDYKVSTGSGITYDINVCGGMYYCFLETV
jgi:hypothetical protein